MSLLPHEPHEINSLVEPTAGSIVSRKVLAESGGRVVLFGFGEGEGLSEHTTPFEALIVMLEGEAKIGLSGKEYDVSAGELMPLPAGIPHSVLAQSPVRLMLVMIKA